jgi:hypothetical protein
MRELSSDAPRESDRRVLSRDLLVDTGVVLGWFVVLGVLCAVVWWQVTPLAEFTRTSTDAQMGEEQLGRQVSSDGWYFTVAAAAGLVSGIALLMMRRRDPVAMVVLTVLGAVLASWLMARVGLWLGPGAPKDALAHVPVGGTVPIQLETHVDGVRFAWPVAAMVGALGVLWGTDESRHTSAPTTFSEDRSGTGSAG